MRRITVYFDVEVGNTLKKHMEFTMRISKQLILLLFLALSLNANAQILIENTPLPGETLYDPTDPLSDGPVLVNLNPEPNSQILTLSAAASTTSNLQLYRWTAGRNPTTKPMDNATAYFRDAFTGINYTAEGTADGDEWFVVSSTPTSDGSTSMKEEEYLSLRYTAQIGDAHHCYRAPGWLYTICGLPTIDISWRLKSQCDPAGQWTYTLKKNGTDLGSASFTMKLEIADDELPIALNQNTAPRHSYDSICRDLVTRKTVPCESGNPNHEPYSIGAKGCAMTSSAMVANYHGGAIPGDIGLITMNNALVADRGFNRAGKVIWSNIQNYGAQQGANWNWIAFGRKFDDAGLLNNICKYGPQIMGVDKNATRGYAGHFVVAYGKEDTNISSQWKILDPAGGKKINSSIYHNRNLGSRLFKGEQQEYPFPMSGIVINLYSPADLVIEDSNRNKVGFDPITNTTYDDIEHGFYVYEAYDDLETGVEDDHPVKTLYIGGLVDPSSFTLSVIGTDYGTYDLEVISMGDDGNYTASTSLDNIATAPGEKHQLSIEYDKSAPGPAKIEAGYLGGGQNSAVNKFIRYSSPSQAKTVLPIGTNEYILSVEYDEAIDPGSLVVTLNGIDISSNFNPLPNGKESVSLTLDEGTNKLIMSVSGVKESGRTAKDTDRLVFVVQ